MALPPTVELAWVAKKTVYGIADIAELGWEAISAEIVGVWPEAAATLRRLLDERPCRLSAGDVDTVDAIAASIAGSCVHYDVAGDRVELDAGSAIVFWWVAKLAAMLERSGLSSAPVEFPVTTAAVAYHASGLHTPLAYGAVEVSWLVRAGIKTVLEHDGLPEDAPVSDLEVAFAAKVADGFAIGVVSGTVSDRVAEALEHFRGLSVDAPVSAPSASASRLRLLAMCNDSTSPPGLFQDAFADGRLSASDAATIAALHTRGGKCRRVGDPDNRWNDLLWSAIAAWKPPAAVSPQLPPIVI